MQTWSSDYDNTLSAFQVMPIQIQMSISRISMHHYPCRFQSRIQYEWLWIPWNDHTYHIFRNDQIYVYIYIYSKCIFTFYWPSWEFLHPLRTSLPTGSQGVPNLRNCKWISSYQHPKVKINKLPSRELGLRYPTLGRLEHHRLKSTEMVFRICSVSGHLNSFDSCQKKSIHLALGREPNGLGILFSALLFGIQETIEWWGKCQIPVAKSLAMRSVSLRIHEEQFAVGERFFRLFTVGYLVQARLLQFTAKYMSKSWCLFWVYLNVWKEGFSRTARKSMGIGAQTGVGIPIGSMDTHLHDWLIFYGKCRFKYTIPMDPISFENIANLAALNQQTSHPCLF